MTGTNPPLRVTFSPQLYSKKVLRLILAKAQEWNCSPAEAQARLLDQIAASQPQKGGK